MPTNFARRAKRRMTRRSDSVLQTTPPGVFQPGGCGQRVEGGGGTPAAEVVPFAGRSPCVTPCDADPRECDRTREASRALAVGVAPGVGTGEEVRSGGSARDRGVPAPTLACPPGVAARGPCEPPSRFVRGAFPPQPVPSEHWAIPGLGIRPARSLATGRCSLRPLASPLHVVVPASPAVPGGSISGSPNCSRCR